MSPSKFSDEIRKTGFELEFRVSEAFRQLGWTVIANKYYVDDHQGTVREIDLVAYRVAKLSEFRVATILVVSCKKNERDAWVLLAKDVDRKDPNMEWQPLHTWSNQPVLKHMLEQPEWRSDYTQFMGQRPCRDLHQVPTRHVFAFQEMNKTTAKPNNDRNIFESITSLMKAQAYELTALPQRNRPPSVYQFNLLSVADTDLIRLDFDGNGDIAEVAIDEETYVARYIIARQQTFARIQIVRFGALSKVLKRYDALHEANADFFDSLNKRFFVDAVRFHDRRALFWNDFVGRLSTSVRWLFKFGDELGDKTAKAYMSWDDDAHEVRIHIDTPEGQIDLLNSHDGLRRRLAELLKRFYRYEGTSRFDIAEDIPF